MTPKHKGSGLIEFALGISVLATLFVGIAQLAYSVIVLNQLTAAVRSGARYASTIEFDEPSHNFAEKVRNYVAYGAPEPEGGADTAAPGLHPHHVSVTWSRDSAGAPTTITVTLRDYAIPFLFRERKLDGRPQATVEFAGDWAPRGRTLY